MLTVVVPVVVSGGSNSGGSGGGSGSTGMNDDPMSMSEAELMAMWNAVTTPVQHALSSLTN